VEKSTAASDPRLDELYREHPQGFVARRNQLAKALRGAGEGDEAERVRKLRRPTVAAWLINRAALESPEQLKEFAEASRQLEDAQAQALEGKEGAADALRAAVVRERDATSAIAGTAEKAARDAGDAPSGHALELVGQTLRAAAVDPELRERVLRGRLEREQSAATLGTPATGPSRRPDPRSAKRRDAAEARRELERLEGELVDAAGLEERLRARVEQLTEALRQEKRKLADRKRETAALKRRVKAVERRAQR
jgi:hypothetical protein